MADPNTSRSHGGQLVAEQVFGSGNFQPTVSHPCGLDSGNPCRNDGPPTFVYNGESWSLAGSQAPAWEPMTYKLQLALLIVAREAGASKTAFPSWSLGTSRNKEAVFGPILMRELIVMTRPK